MRVLLLPLMLLPTMAGGCHLFKTRSSSSSSSQPAAAPPLAKEANQEELSAAYSKGAVKAQDCSAKGQGVVKVTFDGRNGKISSVEVGKPWKGTAAEQCITDAFVGEAFTRFDGEVAVQEILSIDKKKKIK